MSPEDVTACQVKLDAILREPDTIRGMARVVGKVREHAGWTDRLTGEEFPPVWVAEVRGWHSDGSWHVAIVDVDHWNDEFWSEIVRQEVGDL